MDEKRKQAYLFLQYRMILQARSLTSYAYSRFWWHPYGWFNLVKYSRYTCALLNAFHNLAKYAWHNWEEFDEKLFWEGIERLEARYPDIHSNYRTQFEKQLSGD